MSKHLDALDKLFVKFENEYGDDAIVDQLRDLAVEMDQGGNLAARTLLRRAARTIEDLRERTS